MAVRSTVKQQVTLSVGGVLGIAVKESTGRSSTQECAATQRETVFSQQREALTSISIVPFRCTWKKRQREKIIPNCRDGSPGRSEKNVKSIA